MLRQHAERAAFRSSGCPRPSAGPANRRGRSAICPCVEGPQSEIDQFLVLHALADEFVAELLSGDAQQLPLGLRDVPVEDARPSWTVNPRVRAKILAEPFFNHGARYTENCLLSAYSACCAVALVCHGRIGPAPPRCAQAGKAPKKDEPRNTRNTRKRIGLVFGRHELHELTRIRGEFVKFVSTLV